MFEYPLGDTDCPWPQVLPLTPTVPMRFQVKHSSPSL